MRGIPFSYQECVKQESPKSQASPLRFQISHRFQISRSEISCKLPIGVATMKSVPVICRLTQFYVKSVPLGELRSMKEAFFEFSLSLSQPGSVPSCFGTWKLLCSLRLLYFGSSFLLFFVNNLTIYSIAVDKGVICFGSKSVWDTLILIYASVFSCCP